MEQLRQQSNNSFELGDVELRESVKADSKAILEEADYLERQLERPSSYLLVTLREDNTTACKSLAEAGIVRLRLVSRDTYLCRTLPSPADALAVARRLESVRWAGYYMKGFVLSGELVDAEPQLRWWGLSQGEDSRATGPIKPDRRRPLSHVPASRHIWVDLVPHDDIKISEFVLSVRDVLKEDQPGLSPAYGNTTLRVSATLEQLVALTCIDGLQGVYKVEICQSHIDVVGDIIKSVGSVASIQAGFSFDGAGQTVPIADSGFDRGILNDVPPAFNGRIAAMESFVRLQPSTVAGHINTSPADTSGHGTHVAGSIAAYDRMNGRLMRSPGCAAELVVQKVIVDCGSSAPRSIMPETRPCSDMLGARKPESTTIPGAGKQNTRPEDTITMPSLWTSSFTNSRR